MYGATEILVVWRGGCHLAILLTTSKSNIVFVLGCGNLEVLLKLLSVNIQCDKTGGDSGH